MKLEPIDTNRCQAERLCGSFMTFGPRKLIRCTNGPDFIATEKKPGKDGLVGAMSLCESCAEVMKKILGEDFATLSRIAK